MAIQPQDPGARSAGSLDQSTALVEPALRAGAPQAPVRPAQRAPVAHSISKSAWHHDRDISWYGPGLYGNGTACGQKLTKGLVGVAHRSLPGGTLIEFRNPRNGRVVTAAVVDRGPYVSGRVWDLSHGLCDKLNHCYTGSMEWRYAKAG